MTLPPLHCSVEHPCVVKVGGSLFDLPQLGQRLQSFLTQYRPAILVPGGGKTADAIRYLDATQHLGDSTAHWLALRSLALNAHFLATILPTPAPIAATPTHVRNILRSNQLTILDLHAFALDDEHDPNHLPHSWAVTSDSLAARVAEKFHAAALILLKSVDLNGLSWAEAGRLGYVDPFFGEVIQRNHLDNVIHLNFRKLSI